MEALPRVIDRYELLSVLGSGAFATVYRARHVHTQQPVAVKLISRTASVERSLAEARAAAAVQHPNVVRILDCGESGGDVFIVMELAEGRTLADAIAEGPLEPVRAVIIALHILEGLAAAHARGIVHRDIKPANVLLARDERGAEVPKILDFGVSKQLGSASATRDGASIGTPGYMAPELFGGSKNADARSDVYAVSVTLYEMVSARLPFAAATYEELIVKVATMPPTPLLSAAPGIPPQLTAVIDRGMARDPAMRWQSALELTAALRDLMPLLGTMPSASQQRRQAPSSHPAAFDATVSWSGAGAPMAHADSGRPNTLPTPPVVHTARRETPSRALLMVGGAVAAALLLLAGAVTLVALTLARNHPAAPVIAVHNAAPEIAPPPRETTALEPSIAPPPPPPATSVVSTAPEVTAAAHPPQGGVKFKFPAQIVGSVKASAIDALATSIANRAQRCRPDPGQQPVVARMRLFVQEEGTISIAQGLTDPGDADAGACLAVLFKEAASPKTFHPGGGGIVVVEARLDPR